MERNGETIWNPHLWDGGHAAQVIHDLRFCVDGSWGLRALVADFDDARRGDGMRLGDKGYPDGLASWRDRMIEEIRSLEAVVNRAYDVYAGDPVIDR